MRAQSVNMNYLGTSGRGLNDDPNAGVLGAHPVGRGLGALGAGAAVGAAGGAIAGPVGAVAGAVVGAVAGGLAGNAVAEAINPTVRTAAAEICIFYTRS